MMQPAALAARVPMPFEAFFAWIAGLLQLSEANVQNAAWTMATGALCAAACALIGCFLLLRRMAMLGDALSHSVLAGIGGVYLLTGSIEPLPMFMGALLAGIVTAAATQFLHRSASVPEDSSIGIVFTSLFALGVIIISRVKNVHLDLDCVLFGDLAFAGMNLQPTFGWLVPEAFRTLVPALLLTIAFLLLFRKELRLTSFDTTLAATLGFSVPLMHYLMTTVVAIVTVSAMDLVGLLVVALLIVPPCIARMLTDRLGRMLWLSVISGVSCTTLGYLLALRWNSSVAGLTAFVSGVELGLVILLAPRYGLLGHLIRTVRLRIRIAAEDILAGLFRREEQATATSAAPVPLEECRVLAGNSLLSGLAIRWLSHHGLLQTADRSAQFTRRGHKYAQHLVRSHRLWESFLNEHFDLPFDHLHNPAETMEHYIGPAVQQQIIDELHEPHADPHGRCIPDKRE